MSNFIKIRPMGAELWTYITELIVTFCNVVNVGKKNFYNGIQTQCLNCFQLCFFLNKLKHACIWTKLDFYLLQDII